MCMRRRVRSAARMPRRRRARASAAGRSAPPRGSNSAEARWAPSRSRARAERARRRAARRAPRRARAAATARPARGRSRARRELRRGRRRRARAAARGSSRSRRRRAGRLAHRRRRSQSPSASGHEQQRQRRQLDRLDALARPRARARGRGSTWLGTSAPSRAASARSPSALERQRRPSGWRARSTAAASALPPPRPAATGIRLSMLTPQRRQVGRGALAEALDRVEREVRPVHARAVDAVLAALGGLAVHLVRQVERREQRAERVQAVGARRAHVQHEVDLRVARARGGTVTRPRAAIAPPSARRASPSGGEPLGAGVGRMADRSSAARARVADASGAPGASASEPGERLAAVGEPGVHERGQLGGRRRRRAAQDARAPTRRSAPGGTPCAAPAAARAPRTTSWASTRGGAVGLRPPGAAASRSPTSRWTIATQSVRRRQLLDRLEQHGGRHAVGQVRHDLARRRVERGQVELHRVGQVQVDVAERPERVAQRRLERAVDLDDVQVADARRQVLGEHARARRPPRAPRRRRRARRRRPITRRMLSSIRKFWPSSRFGRTPNSRRRRRLAWRGSSRSPAEAPARRSRSTARSSSS